MSELPDFSTPRLAEVVQGLSIEDIDRLPFGVIGLDASGVVRVFNKTEARLSGRGDRPAEGRLFFVDVAPCMDNGYFKGRIDKARAAKRPMQTRKAGIVTTSSARRPGGSAQSACMIGQSASLPISFLGNFDPKV